MTDKLFQTEAKINARSQPDAWQTLLMTLLWGVLCVATLFMDFHWHHSPLSIVEKLLHFVMQPMLFLGYLFAYFKRRSKERAYDR